MKYGYARVSSLEQARDSSALEQQQARLTAAGCGTIFTDVQSGTADNRPQLKAALAALTPADTLVSTRLDRLTRSPSFNEGLLNRFSADGAPGLVLLDDGLDLRTVAGRLTARLLAAVNAAEVERLAERVEHGRSHRQIKGGHGAKPPWCFLRAPDGLGLVVDPNMAGLGTATIQQFLASRSISTTSTWLLTTHGIRKSRKGLERWLKNPCIAGGIGRTVGSVVVKGNGDKYRRPPEAGQYKSIEWDRHTGLIAESQWAEVQRAFMVGGARGGGAHRQVVQRGWWTGTVWCPGCNRRMQIHRLKLRCNQPDCQRRYGHGDVDLALARASFVRAIEWMGAELAIHLAPLQAAANSKAAIEPAELLELRREVAELQGIKAKGVAELVAEKENQIAAMMQQLQGTVVSAAQMLERLLPQLRNPSRLTDPELLALIDDVELRATAGQHWITTVESGRFGCSWTYDPTSSRERFAIDRSMLLTADSNVRLGLDDAIALHRTQQWWNVARAEIERRAAG
jgi:DNA invertase Pin-like site-specific DNA recombinase